jgi:hypothetical protein
MLKFGKWTAMSHTEIIDDDPFKGSPFLVTGIESLIHHYELSGGRDIEEGKLAGVDFDTLLVAMSQITIKRGLISHPPHKQKEYVGFTAFFSYVMPLPEMPEGDDLKGWEPYYGDGTVEAGVPYLFCGHKSVEGRYGNILTNGNPIAGEYGFFWYGKIRPFPYGGDSTIEDPKYFRPLPTGLKSSVKKRSL